MSIEGALSLTVHWDGEAITAAHVRSARRVHAARVLEGRTHREALDTIPRFFATCRRSQHAAARTACAYALRDEADETLLAHAELAALSEYALESLWRLLLDAPPLAGEAPRGRELVAIRAAIVPLCDGQQWLELADTVERALVEAVYGVPLTTWRLMECREWLGHAHAVPRMLSRLLERPSPEVTLSALPWLDSAALSGDIAPSLDAHDDYAAAPHWRGAPAETGSLARVFDHPKVGEVAAHPVVARVVARLVELAAIPTRMRNVAAGDPPRWVRGVQSARGRGLAAVETARGTLIHSVALDGDRVSAWRIVAPTEWNFHPDGAFVRGLAGTPARDSHEARAAAERLAFALDPCVAAEVQVAHA